jgi:hypothetical protein
MNYIERNKLDEFYFNIHTDPDKKEILRDCVADCSPELINLLSVYVGNMAIRSDAVPLHKVQEIVDAALIFKNKINKTLIEEYMEDVFKCSLCGNEIDKESESSVCEMCVGM